MATTTIKANQDMDILFAGDIPQIGTTIIGCINCKDIPKSRIYFRITGGIYNLTVESNSTIKNSTKLCKATSIHIEYSDIFFDSDIPVGEWLPTDLTILDSISNVIKTEVK